MEGETLNGLAAELPSKQKALELGSNGHFRPIWLSFWEINKDNTASYWASSPSSSSSASNTNKFKIESAFWMRFKYFVVLRAQKNLEPKICRQLL